MDIFCLGFPHLFCFIFRKNSGLRPFFYASFYLYFFGLASVLKGKKGGYGQVLIEIQIIWLLYKAFINSIKR